MTVPTTQGPTAPVLVVLRGDPAPEELAALVGVLAAVSFRAAVGGPVAEQAGLWAAPLPHAPRPPGPDAWRASGLPR